MMSVEYFKRFSPQVLAKIIEDAEERIKSNPDNETYVAEQREWIRRAREAFSQK